MTDPMTAPDAGTRPRKLVVFVLALLAGCVEGAPAIDRAKSGNDKLIVEKIAVIEDCSVYRFVDGGYFRYVTICPSGRTSTTNDESHSSGKTSWIVPNNIEMVRKP